MIPTDKWVQCYQNLLTENRPHWKVAYISSIHKKGSKEYCSNYKGISVTSVMSKILRDLTEEENKDEEEQSGFQTG